MACSLAVAMPSSVSNPATDSVDTVAAILQRLDQLIGALRLPTQACCLAHLTTQLACLERGVPVDLLFQSVAGTQPPTPASELL